MPASTGAAGEGAWDSRRRHGRRHRGHRRPRGEGRGIDDRRGGNRRDPRAKRRDVAGAVGIQAARQEDHVAAGRRVDPHAGAGEARVPERADREELAAIATSTSCRCPSQARARQSSTGGVAREVMRATVAGASTRTPSSVPPPSSMRANRDRSVAVPNNPAWPATPPIRRAVGSCTTPRSGEAEPAACTATGPGSSQRSVGAIRGSSAAGGRNPVSRIPSGSKTAFLV